MTAADDYQAAANAAFENEVFAVESALEGERNHTLNVAAFNLGQLVPTYLEEVAVSEALYQAAVKAGLEPRESYATLRSGLQAGMRKPRQPVIRPKTGNVTELTESPETGPNLDIDPVSRGLIDWKTFWDEERPDQEWLCEPLIAAGQAVSLYSPAKVGKSLVSLEIVAALATGRAILGNAPQKPIVIAYVDHEQTEDDLHDRLTDLGYGPDDDLSNLHYYLLGDWPPLDTPQGGVVLLAEMRRIGARLVVIDTISRTFVGEENDADTFIALYRETIRPLKQHKIAFLRLDHTGKDVSKGQRGSSAKTGDIDAAWELTLRGENQLTLKRKFSRTGYGASEIFLTRQEAPLCHIKEVADVAHQGEVGRVVQLLDQYGIPLEHGKVLAGRALRDYGEKVRNTILMEAVRIRRSREELRSLEFSVDDASQVKSAVPASPDGPGPPGDRFSGTAAANRGAVPVPPPYNKGGPEPATPNEDPDPNCIFCGERMDPILIHNGYDRHIGCGQDEDEGEGE